MKLHELEDRMPLPLRVSGEANGKPFNDAKAICAHLDGAYSYCFLEEDPKVVFHLHAGQEMKEVDGRWEPVSRNP